MTWPAVHVRTLLGWIVCALLVGMFVPAARADGPTLTATFGIAGHYHPGSWCPVFVTVHNPNGDSITGQIQVLSADASAQSPSSRFRPSAPPAPMLFSRPISLPGGMAKVQTFPVYVRGMDPSQSDVTIQLVAGQEQGDGRVLARISTQDQNTSAAITGTPVSAVEPLLVGFGGDPGAFTFLNGLKLNTSWPQAAQVQVAEAATAADLPDRAAGYGGVFAVLLRSDAPMEALTEAQSDALRGWVASGGHLIVVGGPDTTRFGTSFYQGLLPAAATAAATMTTSPVTTSYGAGCVTLTAANPADWRPLLLNDAVSPLLTHAARREENVGLDFYGGGFPLLSQAVMRGPALDAPGTTIIGLFLLVYLIMLVPANYLILKRLDRKELAWVTIPVLVLIFALGTFAVGYAAKGGSLFVNRAALVETTAGRREAGVYSEIGLFSPRRTSYDLSITGTNIVAALPNPGFSYGYSSNRSESQSYGQTRFVQTPDGVALPDMAYSMWSMRAFDVQSNADLGGTLTAQFHGLTGTVTNHTPHALTDCAVLWNNGWQPLGGLAPGASLPMTLQPPRAAGNRVGLPPLPVRGSSDAGNTQGDVHTRMQAALAEYVRSLGLPTNNFNGGQSPAPYAPAPGEALLIGWSKDPSLAGPAPRVDGHAVTENDVSLVIVHIPVTASKSGGGQ